MTPPRIRNGKLWRWTQYAITESREYWAWRADNGTWGRRSGASADDADKVWALDVRSFELDGARRQG